MAVHPCASCPGWAYGKAVHCAVCRSRRNAARMRKGAAPVRSCRRCGEIGHYVKTCPKPTKEVPRCTLCRKVGHFLVDCPLRTGRRARLSLPRASLSKGVRGGLLLAGYVP